ncbi:hypothetical protein L0N33_20815, partial [Roseburia faecis]|nr:hypothetical protein [Roseburia faecis]
LSYLTVARDNLKQSVADLLGLRLAVGLANAKGAIGVAGVKVHFLGTPWAPSQGPTCWRLPTSRSATRRRTPCSSSIPVVWPCRVAA